MAGERAGGGPTRGAAPIRHGGPGEREQLLFLKAFIFVFFVKSERGALFSLYKFLLCFSLPNSTLNSTALFYPIEECLPISVRLTL